MEERPVVSRLQPSAIRQKINDQASALYTGNEGYRHNAVLVGSYQTYTQDRHISIEAVFRVTCDNDGVTFHVTFPKPLPDPALRYEINVTNSVGGNYSAGSRSDSVSGLLNESESSAKSCAFEPTLVFRYSHDWTSAETCECLLILSIREGFEENISVCLFPLSITSED